MTDETDADGPRVVENEDGSWTVDLGTMQLGPYWHRPAAESAKRRMGQ